MKVEFVLNSIKDRTMIYSSQKVEDENFGEVTQVEYIGTNYCENLIALVKSNLNEIKDTVYKGQTGRIANEEYELITSAQSYQVVFTIDSHEDKQSTQLQVSVLSENDIEYDIFLENLKINIKEILIKEWESCTWIVDEQSEFLGMQLYPKIFKIENKIRAFVNKVLTYHFGVNWSELVGLEEVLKSYNKNKVDFKREVPEFNNINDILISATMESLAKILLKSNIYDVNITITESEAMRLHKQLADSNSSSVFSIINEARKPKFNLWEDIFSKYFGVDNDPPKNITNFIKNRNHIAHNKLLTKNAYEKMQCDFENVEKLFNDANSKFIDEEPSDELCLTMQAEQEQAEQEEEYIFGRIKDETGIEILDSDAVFDKFYELVNDFYSEIDDGEYFNYAVQISSLFGFDNSDEKQILFSVESKVDDAYNFNVCADFDINEGMDEDSYMNIWVEELDGTKVLKAQIVYHNGEAHEDTLEGYYIPDSESFIDDENFRVFTEDLKTYIKEEMNVIKSKVDMMSYSAVKDGGFPPVSDFPCWNCNQEYISLDNEIYPYGYCINCGEETELKKCVRCQTIYLADDGNTDLCDYCYDRLKKE